MKKWITGLLLIVTLFGLVACGGNDDKDTTNAPIIRERILEVGYGKACITPTEPVQMLGGMYTDKLEDIYAIATAFKDEEGNTYIHVVTDLSEANATPGRTGLCDKVRDAAQKQLGIDPAFLTVGGIHNHSEVDYNAQTPANRNYYQNVLLPQILASIQQALNDLSPAEMFIARAKTERLNFVRRYILEDGTFYGVFDGGRDDQIARHETEPDEELQLVKFVRESKEDVLMVNWQCHATITTSFGTNVCADYVGTLRDKVEAELDVNCVFYQGAAGNLIHTSRIPGEALYPETNWETAQKVGSAVADHVIDAYNSEPFTRVKTGLIRNKRVIVSAKTRKYNDKIVAAAKKVLEYENLQFGTSFGIQNFHHASAIFDAAEQGDIFPIELNIISIGDVAFTTLPVEFFDTTGMQIKDGSPFEMTIMLGYSCGVQRYIADEKAYLNGGYESYNTWHEIGTAEICVEQYLKALKECYQIRFVNE